MRLITYNIRHAAGVDGKVRLKRIAAVLRQNKPHLIALQEVDRHLPRSYLRHQARVLARQLDMNFVFAANMRWLGFCQYGLAILSRYPILEHQYTPLPSGQEPRGLLTARLAWGKEQFFLLNTHLGLNQRERKNQLQIIQDFISKLVGHVILAGDMNTEPPELSILGRGRYLKAAVPDGLPSFPSYRPQFALDHVFVSKYWQVLAASTPSTEASDHLPVLVELILTKEQAGNDHTTEG